MPCRTPLVKGGADYVWPRHFETAKVQHTPGLVYCEMMLIITMEYNSLPDVMTLPAHKILFFYEGIRATLHEQTKPKPGK